MSRTRKLAWIASGTAFIWLTAHLAAGNDSAKVAAHLEKIAADLPWLAVDNVIYDRDPRPGWGPDTDKVTTILAQLVKLEADPSTAPATAPSGVPPTSASVRTRARDERPFWYPRLSATLANPDNV